MSSSVDELTTISRAGHLMLNCADAIALMQDRLAEVQHKHDVRFSLTTPLRCPQDLPLQSKFVNWPAKLKLT